MRKLCVRSLRRGVGSMDFIQGLLIMEDDLDEGHEEDESDVTPTSSTSTDLACLLSIRKLSIFQFLVDKNLLPK